MDDDAGHGDAARVGDGGGCGGGSSKLWTFGGTGRPATYEEQAGRGTGCARSTRGRRMRTERDVGSVAKQAEAGAVMNRA